MKSLFACEKCGKIFTDSADAWDCEIHHCEPCTWVRTQFDKSFDEYRDKTQGGIADAFISELEYTEGQAAPKALTVFMYRTDATGIDRLEGYKYKLSGQTPNTVIESDRPDEN